MNIKIIHQPLLLIPLLVLGILLMNFPLLQFEETEFFHNITFLSVYFVFWGVLLDFFVLHAEHFRYQRFHYSFHLFFGLIFGIQAAGSLLFVAFSSPRNNFFYYNELSCIAFGLLNAVLGLLLRTKMQSPFMEKKLFVYLTLHWIISSQEFVGRKFQLLIYFYYFLGKNPLGLLVPIFIQMMFIVASYYLKFKSQIEPNDNFNEDVQYLIQSQEDREKREIYKEIFQSLINGEYLSLLDTRCSLSIQVNNLDGPLMEKSNAVEWVIVENYLVDITSLAHPLGQFILSNAAGKDITRELYGLKSFMYSNSKGTFRKSFKASHSAQAMKLVKEQIIECIPIAPLIFDVNQKRMTRETLEILFEFQKNKSFHERFDSYYVRQRFDFELVKIQMIKSKNRSFKFDLRINWFDMFGKYYMLKTEQGQMEYVYPILSLTPVYLMKKFEWLQQVQNTLQTNLQEEFIEKLMKNGEDFLEDMAFEKLACVSFTNKDIKEGEYYEFKGPLGFGLELNADCTGIYFFTIRDEGILPVLDFLEYIEQLMLIQHHRGQNVPHFLFEDQYKMSFCNEPQFYFYWEISNEYYKTAQSLGLPNIHTIAKIIQMSSQKILFPIKKIIVKCHKFQLNTEVVTKSNKTWEKIEDILDQL